MRKRNSETLVPDEDFLLFVDQHTPESLFLIKEEYLSFVEALQQLNEVQQEIIILHAHSGLKFREIGPLFAKSENWARVTYYRAKIKLGEYLKEVNVDETRL